MQQLTGALRKEGHDRYCLLGDKAVLFVRLLGTRKLIRFTTGDKVAFRIDTANLTVEDLTTHAIRRKFPWDRIESAIAGEPESVNSDLFQG